ncbi:MAG: DUF1684 domain-containing protein [Chloroflexota bacterium]
MTHDHGHDDHHDHDHGHHHHTVAYADAVRELRADKDEFFRANHHSPVPEAERAGFTGLPYYPIDEALRFEELALEPYDGDEPVSFAIPTSDGRLRPAARAGVLRFEIDGLALHLTAYTFENQSDDGSIFVPVLDATSGVETYGAGRYLDLEREEDGTYTLDFNLLYHPSCVYDARFSCPLTPSENRLPVRIEAGERL